MIPGPGCGGGGSCDNVMINITSSSRHRHKKSGGGGRSSVIRSGVGGGTNGDGVACSQQSVLSAMERFVCSINNMDATVLVPSKLRDMDITSVRPTSSTPPVPAVLANTELHSVYLMLNDVKKELLWGTSSSSSSTSSANLMTSTSHDNHYSPPPPLPNHLSLHHHHHHHHHHPMMLINRTNSVVSSASTSSSTGGGGGGSGGGVVVGTNGHNHHHMATSSVGASVKHHRQSSTEDCLGSLGSSSISSSNASDTESDADSMITDRELLPELGAMDNVSHLFVAFQHHLQGLNAILHQLSESADYLSSRYQEEMED